MEKPLDLRIHKLKLARSRALAHNPVDLPTVAEINAEIQRVELGRPSKRLDPVTQGYVDTILGQARGKDRNGLSLFRPDQSRD